MLPGARSYKQGQVTRDEAIAAIAKFRIDYKVTNVTASLDEIEDYTSDLWIVDGDLHVRGGLDLMAESAYLLVVTGNLVVDGCYDDYDDPESFLLVTGDMRARDVITAGWLEVHGSLTADRVIGDYNDCAAYIGGDVHCQLFYGEEHHFTIGGALDAKAVLGRPRLAIREPPTALSMSTPQILEHLDRDLVRIYEDTDEDGSPILDVDGLKDFRAVKRLVREGKPLKT